MAGVCAWLLIAGARPLAGGQLYVVDRADDPDPFAAGLDCNPGAATDCSLRRAVMLANAQPGEDAIQLGAGIWNLAVITRSSVGTDDGAHEGALEVTDDLVISGPWPGSFLLIAGGSYSERLFTVTVGVSLKLYDLRIGGFREAILAAATSSLTLTRSELFDNFGANGGAIRCVQADVEVLFSTLAENSVSSQGGAINANNCSLTIRQSTISGNQAPEGAAIWTTTNSVVTVQFSTIANNDTTDPTSADLFDYTSGTYSLEASIVEGDCLGEHATFTSQGGNLEGPGASCGLDPIVDQVGAADVGLLPLGFYGGTTRTHLPSLGSPAVDDPLGSIPGCTPGQLDQRDVARPQDGDQDGIAACDSGSVELAPLFADGFESGDTSAWSAAVP